MSFWRSGLAGGLVGLALCGCEEPSDIVPVTPPGAVIPRTVNEADASQALGESAPSVTKTEAPTPKRREQAREQGNIARSQDLTAAVVILGLMFMLKWYGPSLVKALQTLMREVFSGRVLRSPLVSAFL